MTGSALMLFCLKTFSVIYSCYDTACQGDFTVHLTSAEMKWYYSPFTLPTVRPFVCLCVHWVVERGGGGGGGGGG